MDNAKLLENVDLNVVDVAKLEEEVKGLGELLIKVQGKFDVANTKLQEIKAGNDMDRKAKAESLIVTMQGLGLSESAIRAALVKEFGTVKVKPAQKVSKSVEEDIQTAIIKTIADANKDGIKMDALYNAFPTVDKADVFSTVKSAVVLGKVRKDGTTRNMKYYII